MITVIILFLFVIIFYLFFILDVKYFMTCVFKICLFILILFKIKLEKKSLTFMTRKTITWIIMLFWAFNIRLYICMCVCVCVCISEPLLTGLPFIIHLKIPWLFPYFFPDIVQFFQVLWQIKKNFLFFSLMVLTISLQIWVLLLKERICSPREQILSFKNSPQWGGRWAYTISWESTSFSLLNRINFLRSACHIHLFSNSLTFQGLSKFPWPSTKFPDFPWPGKSFIFQTFFLDRGNPVIW